MQLRRLRGIGVLEFSVTNKEGKFYWTQKRISKGGKGRIFRANIEMPNGESAASRSDIEMLFSGLPEAIDLESTKVLKPCSGLIVVTLQLGIL